MAMINQQDIEKFKREYRADVNKSHKEYYKSSYAFSTGQHPVEKIEMEIENGVDITLMQSKFEQMLIDAENGREFRIMRSRHPGVLEAWDKYRMMLILAYRDEGMDPP